MCGICGVARMDGRPVPPGQIRAMTEALAHRGPDQEGSYFSSEPQPASWQVGFGFRRLSIIDLTGGDQPMRHGKNVIVMNGEIYNYRTLRTECEAEGCRFRTQSDTEVLLQLFDRHGSSCLERLNGMFAFAIWDEARRELFLARDRLGIKPLYYAFDGTRFVFASEMKSLLASREVPFSFDPVGLKDYLTYRFVPAPHTVLADVRKLPPGHSLLLREGRIELSRYWSLPPASNAPSRTLRETEDELAAILEDSVRLQLVSDVPVGAFLSGGVDSSLITALMTRNTTERVRTFSIGFREGTGVDESPHSRRVAQFLGTDHHELILSKDDLTKTERLFATMNEPVADPTVLPTAVLSAFARQEVKVVLTGEGGDELFAGYNRYKSVLLARWLRAVPGWLRPEAASVVKRLGKGAAFEALPEIGAWNWFDVNREFRPTALAQYLKPESAYDSGRSYLREALLAPGPDASGGFGDPLNDVLGLEGRTSLPDRLLMKVDMASMGHSLEARPPFLDHRVVELAFRVPADHKIHRFKGKYVLRKVAERFLPRDICWRRKHGFIVPLAEWMHLHSRAAIDDLLDNSIIETIPVVDVPAVRRLKERICSGESPELVTLLWPLIVLSGWIKGIRSTPHGDGGFGGSE